MATGVGREASLVFTAVQGIDFSGARLAGEALWWATLQPQNRQRWRLTRLTSLAALVGSSQRQAVLAYLRQAIVTSQASLWALDFSFALPAVLLDQQRSWREWLAGVARWPDDAPGFGRYWAARARERTGRSNVLRQTERHHGAHLCAYHPHLVYQTFYGVREVLAPLSAEAGTVILPFDYPRLAQAQRVLVEALPAATLRRVGWPDRGYKSRGRGKWEQQRVREQLVQRLATQLTIPSPARQVILANTGGDALDAVLAAWGAIQAWSRVEHEVLAKDALCQREGYEYV